MPGKEFDDGLSQDKQGTKVQVANGMGFADIETTPNTSPLSLAANTEDEIKVPTNAAQMVINCDSDLYFATATGFSNSYSRIPAGIPQVLPCANETSIFLKNPDTSNAVTIYFHFEEI